MPRFWKASPTPSQVCHGLLGPLLPLTLMSYANLATVGWNSLKMSKRSKPVLLNVSQILQWTANCDSIPNSDFEYRYLKIYKYFAFVCIIWNILKLIQKNNIVYITYHIRRTFSMVFWSMFRSFIFMCILHLIARKTIKTIILNP